jgi:septum site-determining protein MinC
MQPKEQIALFDEDTSPVILDRAGEVWSLVVSSHISWDEVRAHIADDLEEFSKELHGRNLRLNLGGRPLDLMEVRRIGTLMRDGFKAALIGIECTPDSVHRYAEQTFKLPLVAPALDTRPRMPLVFTGAPFEDEEEDAVPTDLPNLDGEAELSEEGEETGIIDEVTADLIRGLGHPDALLDIENTDILELNPTVPAEAGRRVMILEKTLRSGKTIRFAGDVMVYGDVNAGAHIEADGNIIVFGSLRGLAHAGARGDDRAVIISFDLGSPQIRIADHIGFTGEEPVAPESPEPQGLAKVRGDVVGGLSNLLRRNRATPRHFSPEIAWVEDGEIRIGNYQGRLPA